MVRRARVGGRGRRRLAVNLHVFAQRARVCVRLVTAPHFTEVRLITCVDVRVLLPVTAVGEFPVAAIKLAFEWLLTCVRPLVNLEIFRTREYFATTWKRTRERLLASVHADVIDQFVLGFKRFSLARTLFPEANVSALLRSANVLHCDMVDELMHGAESFRAGLLGSLFLVYPLADELLLDGLPHVSQKRPRGSVRSRGEVHI